MNLKSALLNGTVPELEPGTSQYICANKAHFSQLMKYFFSGDFHLAHRATLYILEVFEKKTGWVEQWVPMMVNTLDETLPDWQKRNILRILQYQKIPAAQWGQAADQCLKYLASSEQPVAIKVFSMTVLYNLTKDLPDLARELRLHIEEQFPLGSAGFKARGRKVLQKLEKDGL